MKWNVKKTRPVTVKSRMPFTTCSLPSFQSAVWLVLVSLTSLTIQYKYMPEKRCAMVNTHRTIETEKCPACQLHITEPGKLVMWFSVYLKVESPQFLWGHQNEWPSARGDSSFSLPPIFIPFTPSVMRLTHTVMAAFSSESTDSQLTSSRNTFTGTLCNRVLPLIFTTWLLSPLWTLLSCKFLPASARIHLSCKTGIFYAIFSHIFSSHVGFTETRAMPFFVLTLSLKVKGRTSITDILGPAAGRLAPCDRRCMRSGLNNFPVCHSLCPYLKKHWLLRRQAVCVAKGRNSQMPGWKLRDEQKVLQMFNEKLCPHFTGSRNSHDENRHQEDSKHIFIKGGGKEYKWMFSCYYSLVTMKISPTSRTVPII